METLPIVNQKMLAESMGVSRATVARWVKMGILHKMELPGCKFDMDQVRDDLLQRLYLGGYTYEDIQQKFSS